MSTKEPVQTQDAPTAPDYSAEAIVAALPAMKDLSQQAPFAERLHRFITGVNDGTDAAALSKAERAMQELVALLSNMTATEFSISFVALLDFIGADLKDWPEHSAFRENQYMRPYRAVTDITTFLRVLVTLSPKTGRAKRVASLNMDVGAKVLPEQLRTAIKSAVSRK